MDSSLSEAGHCLGTWSHTFTPNWTFGTRSGLDFVQEPREAWEPLPSSLDQVRGTQQGLAKGDLEADH
jgi:hypothetical protein